MPLPAFTEGLLPAGRHRATAEEVRAALVEAFPDSTTRAAIFTFWEDRRAAVADLVDVHGEWLDGSFTTDKRDPADIDLVTIIDGPSFDALPRHRRQVLASLVAGTVTEDFWSCDAGVVVRYPADDLSHARTAVAAGCWAGYYGHTRDGRATGIVELVASDRDPVDVELDDDAAEDPEAQLRAHLARFDRALKAFDDADSTQRPGLRLMATTLRHKRDELRGKLAASQRVEVELRPLAGEPVSGAAMAALTSILCEATMPIGRQLLEAPEATEESGIAQALQLVLVGMSENGAVVLRAPDPAQRRAVPAPDGHESLVTAALQGLLDALADEATEPAADAAAALREAVLRHAVPVEVQLRWPTGQERSVDVRP